MLADIADLTGRRPPRWRIPRAVVIPVAYAAETAARFTGRHPFTTRDGIRMAEHHMFFTAAKAERELGFTARPYRAALEDAIRWFRSGGLSGQEEALKPQPSRHRRAPRQQHLNSRRPHSPIAATAATQSASHSAANSSV